MRLVVLCQSVSHAEKKQPRFYRTRGWHYIEEAADAFLKMPCGIAYSPVSFGVVEATLYIAVPVEAAREVYGVKVPALNNKVRPFWSFIISGRAYDRCYPR